MQQASKRRLPKGADMADTRLLPDGLAVVVETKHGRLYATQDRHGQVILESGGRNISLPRQSARDLAEGISSLVGVSEDDYWSRRMEAAGEADGEVLPPEEEGQAHGSLNRRSFDRIALSDLVVYGLLPLGAVLTCNLDDVSHEAVVTKDGRLELSDYSTHSTPSAALRAASGKVRNGWEVWQTSDGVTLYWLRLHMKARWHAIDSATPNTTLHLRGDLMASWIDHCREQKAEPKRCDTQTVDDFIAEFCSSHHADPDEMREVLAGWFFRWEPSGGATNLQAAAAWWTEYAQRPDRRVRSVDGDA